MSSTIYRNVFSIAVSDDKSDALTRVRMLNEELEQLCKRFDDLKLMMFPFSEEDFHDDIVYTTQGRMIPRPGIPAGHITIHAGQSIFRDFAKKHNIPFRETPPPGHPDHIHEGY